MSVVWKLVLRYLNVLWYIATLVYQVIYIAMGLMATSMPLIYMIFCWHTIYDPDTNWVHKNRHDYNDCNYKVYLAKHVYEGHNLNFENKNLEQ